MNFSNNYVSLLNNHFAGKDIFVYTYGDETLPPFGCVCKSKATGNEVRARAVHLSKKQAKQDAAQQMWNQLTKSAATDTVVVACDSFSAPRGRNSTPLPTTAQDSGAVTATTTTLCLSAEISKINTNSVKLRLQNGQGMVTVSGAACQTLLQMMHQQQKNTFTFVMQ